MLGALSGFVIFSLVFIHFLTAEVTESWSELDSENLPVLKAIELLHASGVDLVVGSNRVLSLKQDKVYLVRSGGTRSELDRLDASLTGEVDRLLGIEATLKSRHLEYKKLVNRYFPEEREIQEAISSVVMRMVAIAESLIDPDISSPQLDTLQNQSERLGLISSDFSTVINRASENEFSEVDERGKQLGDKVLLLKLRAWVVGPIVLTILIITGLFFLRGILRPLAQLNAASEDIAKGDFDVSVPVDRNDEIGQLAQTFNHMAVKRCRAEDRLKIAKVRLEEKNLELDLLSKTDHLTGLYNRLYIESCLLNEVEKALRYKRAFSIMIIDLDKFKSINDHYGHNMGDEVLRQISKLLAGRTRTTDVVGRWGGEEFIVLCPETDSEQGRVLAENLRYMSELQTFSGVEKTITVSIGVAQYNGVETEQQLLYRADQALYEAKANGRNRVALSGKTDIKHSDREGEAV